MPKAPCCWQLNPALKRRISAIKVSISCARATLASCAHGGRPGGDGGLTAILCRAKMCHFAHGIWRAATRLIAASPSASACFVSAASLANLAGALARMLEICALKWLARPDVLGYFAGRTSHGKLAGTMPRLASALETWGSAVPHEQENVENISMKGTYADAAGDTACLRQQARQSA